MPRARKAFGALFCWRGGGREAARESAIASAETADVLGPRGERREAQMAAPHASYTTQPNF